MMKHKKCYLMVIALLNILLLAGCQKETDAQVVQKILALESGDECHLCGMIITQYPGPKGQLYSRGIEGNMKFCSTRDMFAFIVDPENQHNIQKAFVHDMANTDWQSPSEESYIDAKQAFYVIGHSKKGAMGPTLASFSQRKDAESFTQQMGGKVFSFEQITLDVLVAMTGS